MFEERKKNLGATTGNSRRNGVRRIVQSPARSALWVVRIALTWEMSLYNDF